jgi:hypothetical protein
VTKSFSRVNLQVFCAARSLEEKPGYEIELLFRVTWLTFPSHFIHIQGSTMKTISCFIFSILLSVPVFAAGRALDAKALLAFLPSAEVKGATRMEMPGQDLDGLTSAQVMYMTFEAAGPKTASLAVMDGKLHSATIGTQIAVTSEGDEAVMVKGKYKGRRNNKQETGGMKSVAYEWIVGGRFLVSIRISGTDSIAEAEKYIDMIDLSAMEKAAAGK